MTGLRRDPGADARAAQIAGMEVTSIGPRVADGLDLIPSWSTRRIAWRTFRTAPVLSAALRRRPDRGRRRSGAKAELRFEPGRRCTGCSSSRSRRSEPADPGALQRRAFASRADPGQGRRCRRAPGEARNAVVMFVEGEEIEECSRRARHRRDGAAADAGTGAGLRPASHGPRGVRRGQRGAPRRQRGAASLFYQEYRARPRGARRPKRRGAAKPINE